MEREGDFASYLCQIAREELNETAESKRYQLVRLKEILDEKGVVLPRNYADFLLRFLRVAKFDFDKAFERVIAYNKGRAGFYECYPNTRPSNVIPYLEQKVVYPTNVKPGVVFYADPRNWNTKTADLHMMFQHFQLMLEKLLEEPRTQILGVSFVADTRISLSQCLHVIQHANVLFKLVSCLQSVLPIRFKGAYFCNAPKIFQPIFKLVKAFFSDKLKKRVFMFSGCEELKSYLSLDEIPISMGGNATCSPDIFTQDLLEWEPTWINTYMKNYKDQE